MGRIRRITVSPAELDPEEENFFNLFVLRIVVAIAPLVKRLF